MTEKPPVADGLLSTSAVARMFNVTPRTINRWASQGLIEHVTLPSGRRRYAMSTVLKVIDRKGTE